MTSALQDSPSSIPPSAPDVAPRSSASSAEAPHPHPATSIRILIWASLGVVFGDIGTSPLYAMSETVSSHLGATRDIKDKVTMSFGQYYGRSEVLGWTSLFFWAIALVVTLKYVILILRADNEGEGGMFSILGLLKAKASQFFSARGIALVTLMAVVGSGLILGDGVITPSLSIMSAWEGLEIITPRWSPFVPWLSIATLIALFGIQRAGSHRVGALFAPAMAIWFAMIGVIGLFNLVKHPDVAAAMNPLHAIAYMRRFPGATFYVIGSVDLCITGCEALYADMGHFSRPAVRRAWFWVVWPALVLNYLGQGARLLDPAPIVDGNVFFALVPSTPFFVYPLVFISWLATIIASQALISGAFSLVGQAVQLGLFPRVSVVHTNAEVEGQIYIPEVNWAYLSLCILLVVAFRSSHNLAPAYGLAVTGTMAFTTILFYLVATRVWHWSRFWIGPVCGGLIFIDLGFFVSNATQFMEGGYITILIATLVAFAMLTWRRGRAELAERLQKTALPIDLFLASVAAENPLRVKGTAVFMTSNSGAPHTLMHYFKHAKSLHRSIVFLTVRTKHVPVVPEERRIVDVVSHGEGVYGATVTLGFMETPDIPKVIRELTKFGIDVDVNDVSYFLGRESLVFVPGGRMSLPRKMFFKFLSNNAQPASTFFRLPPGRVIELGIQIEM
ncbi:MAG TPA: KUP/HAK/KT family potassium transporter [Polyangiaceae bacterium]|nr:KUP/HAK/KT family potassium transporter [Polyangiaceae bacterium]